MPQYIFSFGHGPNLEKQALNLIYFFSLSFVVVLLPGTKCSSLILFYFALEPLQLALNVWGFLMRPNPRKVSNFLGFFSLTFYAIHVSHAVCAEFSNCHQLLASWEKHFLLARLMIIDFILEFYRIDIYIALMRPFSISRRQYFY